MRLFIGVPVAGAARRRAAEVQEMLRGLGVKGNYSRPENLHVTLAFLGEQPDISRAAEALASLSAEPGELLFTGLGTFPKNGVIFLAPENDAPLRRAAEALALRLRAVGIPPEDRPFRAHLTLCRSCKSIPPALPEIPAIPLPMEEIILYESHRVGGLLTYTPRGRISLPNQDYLQIRD